MPTQLLSVGPLYTLVQNQAYALPAKPVIASASAAIETSNDGSVWTAASSSYALPGIFVRATGVGTTVVLRSIGGGSGSGSGGGSIRQSGPITITNAQILTLNSVGITVIPAPGPNRINIPVMAHIRADIIATYTEGTPDSTIALINDASGDFDNASDLSAKPFFSAFKAGRTTWVTLAGPAHSVPALGFVYIDIFDSQFSNWTNKPTQLWGNGTGWSGGNVGNVMTVSVLYQVYDISTKTFV